MVTRDECIKTLYEISKLEDNWNDNGAPAFTDEVIKKAEELIGVFPRYPEIFPTAAGSIQLEWEDSDAKYLEIEVFSKRKIKIFVMNGWNYHHGSFLFNETDETND